MGEDDKKNQKKVTLPEPNLDKKKEKPVGPTYRIVKEGEEKTTNDYILEITTLRKEIERLTNLVKRKK
ncbi:MAG: hypothetical protein NT009_12995 [Proteobacteria bacterium]|nr:hypothetical protein [Pseudomonadota bacterium]